MTIECPRCHNKEYIELYHSKTDAIDGLDHSHMECKTCGYHYNYWNESIERLKEVYRGQYKNYTTSMYEKI